MTEDGKPPMNLRRKYSKVIKRMPNAYAGLYKYFNDLDEDCSGFLEKNEIHGLAKKFFGEDSAQQEKAQQYVEQVFDEYDVDKSGELSYEEARDFLKGIMAYLDKNGNLTDAARAEFMAMLKESEETEMIEEMIEVEVPDDGEDKNAGNDNSDANADQNNNADKTVVSEKIEQTKSEISPVTEDISNKDIVTDNITTNVQEPAEKPAIEEPVVEEPIVEAKPAPKTESAPPQQPTAPIVEDTTDQVESEEEFEEEEEEIEEEVEIPAFEAPVVEYKDMPPEPKAMIDPIPTSADGKPRLGRFGELLDAEGNQVLAVRGCIIGPDAKPLLATWGELRGPDGKSLLGEFKEILGADGLAILGRFGEILGADGKAVLGRFGELLGPDGKPLLGPPFPPGCLLGPDGKPLGPPLLGPDGQPIPVEKKVRKVNKLKKNNKFDKKTEDTPERKRNLPATYEYKPKPLEENNQKSMTRKPMERKKWDIKKAEAHDGFCPVLKIWRPLTQFENNDEVPEELKKFKWIRDPITDQWIDARRIGQPARVA